MTSNEHTIPDWQVRRLAETTFDRNVVVVAGAGTGKTTLLVNRLIHALMREPQPVTITQVVALTFTNKAATEMKVRLRERLMGLAAAAQGDSRVTDFDTLQAADLRERYGLSGDRLVERAQAALRDLEKAQIGTLHSFAAHLLRLYPIEAGVDPEFQTDEENLRFAEHFAAQWDLWLDGELGPNGPHHACWRRLLAEMGLTPLRELAEALSSELVPLEELKRQIDSDRLPPAINIWLAAKRDWAAKLLAAHDRPTRRKVESLLAATRELFGALLEQGIEGIPALKQAAGGDFARELGSCPSGWTEEEFAEACSLIRVAKRIVLSDRDLMRDLLAILPPFVQRVRASFLAEGWISFDGLLARARTLLREHPTVRERLKRDYQAVLVDEFQDTDPTQYEIILYLTERPGRIGDSWQEVDLAPGKLFIVGDPKQSIYAFRRADIEAFDRVVNKILASGGVVYALATNFRSHGQVLDVVNALFDRLFRPLENVQPPNVPLAVRPDRAGGLSHPGVSLRLIESRGEEELDSATATRLEAESLARWLKEEVLAHETWTDPDGRRGSLKPGHVALLFRKLTQAQEYLDALRRHGIAYVTDGEKHFYRRQEVVDLVNLLRAVENPHDTIALVGLLRSSLGGVTDRELYELNERRALDYRRTDRLDGWDSPRAVPVRSLYARLADLHRAVPGRPLPEAVDDLFASLPVLELAAASLHGEQAVANLMKIRQMAAELADRPQLTLHGFVDLMIARLSEQPREAESALAEESLEAVRVLTIHKAKGLEFPVVILPGLHHGANAREDSLIAHDWSTGLLGLSLGERRSLGAVLVGEKVRVREEAERYRVFYVGMTRARERVVLSGGLPARLSRGTFLALLKEAAGDGIGNADRQTISIGPVQIDQTVLAATDRAPRDRGKAPVELQSGQRWADLAACWSRRDRAWEAARLTPRRLTPALLMRQEVAAKAGWQGRVSQEHERVRLFGTLAHRVLESWDFASGSETLIEQIGMICGQEIPEAWATETATFEAELTEMFAVFVASEPCAELRQATILGREIPFAIPWSEFSHQPSAISHQPCLMEGVMDVLYRLDGTIWIADYKTDRLEQDELAGRAAEYAIQAQAYREAASRCLGLEQVGFKFIFVRNGAVVQV